MIRNITDKKYSKFRRKFNCFSNNIMILFILIIEKFEENLNRKISKISKFLNDQKIIKTFRNDPKNLKLLRNDQKDCKTFRNDQKKLKTGSFGLSVAFEQ